MATTGEVLTLVERATYVGDVKPHLPAGAFARARSRLVFLPVQLVIVVMATLAISRGWIPLYLAPLASIAIGAAFAMMAFVTHEVLHGAIIGGRHWQRVLGWVGFLPFALGPTLWTRWHNRTHHSGANQLYDPDRYPTLEEYKTMRAARVLVDGFSPGAKRLRGVLTLAFGFTGQIIQVLLTSKRRDIMTAREQRVAFVEMLLAVAVWAAVGFAIGLVPFIFAYVIPLAIANACVMAFILTNHSLNPVVTIDDPLASGLSVTLPRPIEWLTLGFGYHVEHHLFPAMSTRHARTVRAVLQERWAKSYHSMPLFKALLELHRSARVYKDATTLVDPRTGTEFPTLT
jgi:fatty acid desaturase